MHLSMSIPTTPHVGHSGDMRTYSIGSTISITYYIGPQAHSGDMRTYSIGSTISLLLSLFHFGLSRMHVTDVCSHAGHVNSLFFCSAHTLQRCAPQHSVSIGSLRLR